MGVWQGVAMASLSVTRALHALPFYALRAATPEGSRLTPIGHPTPYASVFSYLVDSNLWPLGRRVLPPLSDGFAARGHRAGVRLALSCHGVPDAAEFVYFMVK
jgi:hypothetical protein